MGQMIQSHAILDKGVRNLSIVYNEAKRKYKLFINRIFICIKISKKWKKRYLFYGGSFDAI